MPIHRGEQLYCQGRSSLQVTYEGDYGLSFLQAEAGLFIGEVEAADGRLQCRIRALKSISCGIRECSLRSFDICSEAVLDQLRYAVWALIETGKRKKVGLQHTVDPIHCRRTQIGLPAGNSAFEK